MMKRIVSLVIYLFLFMASYGGNSSSLSMQQMVKRLFPDRSGSFIFREIQSDKDCFIIESQGRQILISGNNANSMAMGLNYYLKRYCLTTVSWYKRDPIELPKALPRLKSPLKVQSRVPVRFFLNYCTYGYTMPWWSWGDWERFIDWMALNGVNMPLAITGQESIWYNVWKKFGMTDSEIRNYFTGPAHLPWHRMCNIDGWQGPLPKSWLDNQKALQQKILKRERELNMNPVLPAFSGHVPSALSRLYPNARITGVSQWGNFDQKYHCSFLSPMDSLYNVIQKLYLAEQTRLYGTDHIYGVDPFNEVDPPSWREDSLSEMSSRIYHSMQSVDKEAKWLQMTWMFYYNSENWTAPRMRAMVKGVPQGKMILLDYFCDNTEIWRRTESYFGQPYIWCYLGNFGGNTMICGPLSSVSKRLSNTYREGGTNFVGIGSTLEGLDVNQFAYEFVMDKAWDIPQTDSEWIDRLADRRLGVTNAVARAAWKKMYDKVLTIPSTSFHGTLIENRPSLKSDGKYPDRKFFSANQQQNLVDVWKQLLSIPNVSRDTYRFDVVNIGRQVLGGYFEQLQNKFTSAYESGNVDSLKLVGSEMKAVLKDVDALVACHSTFSLKNWIESARAMGKDAAEKDYYEKNARTLITVWGDTSSLTDYARRGWSGLISNYYAPCWIMFIDKVTACTEQHKVFDEQAFVKECYDLERKFIEPSYPITYVRSGDGIQFARNILKKYGNKLN